MTELSQLQDNALKQIEEVDDIRKLEELRVKFLGKKGQVTQLLKQLGGLSAEERPIFGQKINKLKQLILNSIEKKKQKLDEKLLEQKLKSEKIDVTLPGRGKSCGSLHPVTLAKNRIVGLFNSLGFTIAEGPEIETDYYNFEALNIPSFHPARAMQDTFYFNDGKVLRTHTSPVQIRFMENKNPPFKIIAPGRVYRCDSDVTHTPMFHQVEGLMVAKDVTFANLKGIIITFLQEFFQSKLKVRFRPSYFPFTEPSAEVDMQCVSCKGTGKNGKDNCRICSGTGWLEVLGCGMVHPKVLENCNINSEEYTGWAFGVGIDRLAMLYYGIPDLRMLFENDLTFLEQF